LALHGFGSTGKICRVQILFRQSMPSDGMVKLTNEDIKWWVMRVNSGFFTVKKAAQVYGVTERRVQQLIKMHRETGGIPRLNPNRRPKTSLSADQKAAIEKAREETRLGARLLFYELRRRGQHVPHNKIHQYLRATGRSVPNPRKQKQRKRCRYEREHSGDLVHGDWHRTTVNHPNAIIWLDDASRLALAGGEFKHATHVESIDQFKEAQTRARAFDIPIREVNTDRDSRFYSNKSSGTSAFELYLEREGIGHVPSRKGNPQTNGKLERLWLEYDRHRWRFDSLEAFLTGYNNRIHGALDYREGETPEAAFLRRAPPEAILGRFLMENKRYE
jgi:putative transposase